MEEHFLSRTFSISSRRSAGNLHIQLSGEFGGTCAWELVKMIRRQYSGSGRIFVRTDGLKAVHPSGIDLFKEHMRLKTVPLVRLYLKGQNGFLIAPDGARVLISNRQKGAAGSRLPLCPACKRPAGQ
jgi:hypothetical protein